MSMTSGRFWWISRCPSPQNYLLINALFSALAGTRRVFRYFKGTSQPRWFVMAPVLKTGTPRMAVGKRHMTDRDQSAIVPSSDPEPGSADLYALPEVAIHNLSLGIVIFNDKREVVFCNRRYRDMYGLTAEQVKPGTPTS